MRLILTGVTFTYPGGYGEDWEGVNLTFNNSGATYNLQGYISVTKEQYLETNGNRELLTDLIKEVIATQLEAK